jgi:hypothetical protein
MTGLRAAATRCQSAAKVVEEYVDKGFVRHLLDVGAGGERLLGAGDHHAGDRAVGLELIDGGGQFAHQRAVERIERLRPVEPDQPDFVVGLDNDVLAADFLAAHGRISRPVSPIISGKSFLT